MAEQQTIDHLVGLAVAMLGVAPGAKWLNARAKDIDAGATVDDVANQIQSSGDFEARYPAFLSDAKFAEDFLGDLIGGHVTDAIMVAAVDLVTGQLKAGASRGEVAAFLVEALTIVAADEDNAFYADFGKAATAFHNKVMVAKHYTEEARMEDPSASVLEGVTDAADSVTAAINLINNPPQPRAEPETGKRFVLTPTIDDFEGGDLGDTFVAQPVQGADGLFNATLNSFDSIDGGGGTDTIHIFGVNPRDTLRLGAEDIRNVENVVINTVGHIDADLREWSGLEMVTLDRFGRDDETTVDVTVDGAKVAADREFQGDVTILGASGAVDIEAGGSSDVVVGSGEFEKDIEYTDTVMVKGGASVTVAKNAAGAQSATVTRVVLDGVAVGEKPENEGVREADGSGAQEATIRFNETGDTQVGGVNYVVPNAADAEQRAFRNVTATEVVLEGPYYIAADQDVVLENEAEGVDDAALTETQILVTTDRTKAKGYDKGSGGTPRDAMPTVNIHSDAIEAIQLHNTKATAVVKDESKTADGKKGSPAPLTVAVEDFDGELRLTGAGASDEVTFNVVKDSTFDLVAGTVKMITVGGDGKLTLDVDGSTDGKPSTALEKLVLSGAGKFTMDAEGMTKLETVDAAEAGDVMLTKAGDSLLTYTGGDGKDHLTVVEAHNTKNGLTVDLGAGDDHFSSTGAGNAKSSVSGGAGRDTLHLTTDAGVSQGTGAAAKSIYSDFEVLDVGGSAAGTYDVELLGVGEVTVSKSTTGGAVTLKNMGSTQGFSVGTTGTDKTMATIVHHLREREAGTSRNDRTQLEVDLNGGNKLASIDLTLTTDAEIRDLVVSSGTTGSKTSKPSTNVDNKLTLSGTSVVEEIIVDGNAKLEIVYTGTRLDYVDATASEGGVEIDASTSTEEIEMLGGNGDDEFIAGDPGAGDSNMLDGGGGKDKLSGGGNADTLMGGAGEDILTGGAGDDNFVFTGDSRSHVTFKADGTPQGHDTITDFEGGTDLIHLGKGLLRGELVGGARDVGNINVAATGDPATLKAFLDANGDGLFEDRSTGGDNQVIRDTIVFADEGSGDDSTPTSTWIFIDVNGNGDWDGEEDMAIKLMGDIAVANTNFADTLLT